MTSSKAFLHTPITFLMLTFVVIVSLALVFLDLERRDSVSNAQLASDLNQVYSRANGALNGFYWKSADTTIGVTLQGIQQNLFTEFDRDQTIHPKINEIVLNAFKLNASVSQIRWIDANGVERYRMKIGEPQIFLLLSK